MTIANERILQLQPIIHPFIPRFERFLRLHALFHIATLWLIVIEGFLIFLFFTFLAKSMLMAFAISILFLTLFSYFMLRAYFQAVKPEQMQALKNQFIDSYKTVTNFQESVPEYLLGLSHACCKLSDELGGCEYRFCPLPIFLNGLKHLVEKGSCWLQWQDVLQMRELLLLEAVAQHVRLVRCEPTHPEAHAALANSYVLLSMLYAASLKNGANSKSLDAKFRKTASKAIEEFQILRDYAPNDPWVHQQLAYSYHDLCMPLEEIREYETILQINPQDQETRFKLGSCYFQQDMNAKGLRIYEELRRIDPKRAEALIRLYS